MIVFNHIKDLRDELCKRREKGNSIGLVPTMGALHEGHLSLVKRALTENEVVVVSIFVNPTQFTNTEDLQKYPRMLEEDLAKLQQLTGVLFIFCPTVEELYGSNVNASAFHFGGLAAGMEGAHRKGHFNGVATVVLKIFEAVEPHRAYFGEKDYQQLRIVQELVKQRRLPIHIICCPILREASGLAMSSRNERLSSEMRQKAGFIYKTLLQGAGKFKTQSAQNVKDWIITQFSLHPDFSLEYVEIAHAITLQPVLRKTPGATYRLFIAVYAEGVRLIDTIPLE